MSQTLYFAYPGELQTRTGGYGYDRRVIGALGDLGWDVKLVPLGEGFPARPDLAQADSILAAIPDGSILMVDGLAFGVLDGVAETLGQRVRLFALVHHPLALETGLSEQTKAELAARERAALACTRGTVVTSAATARELVENYSIANEDVVTALPGTDPVPRSTGSGDVPSILSVGSLTRRKGHDVLIAALATLRDHSWTCRIVGSRDLDADVADELEQLIQTLQLQDRVTLVGEVEDVQAEFAGTDIFALASRYEGYGMVFAEALAHGLPIVGCAAGAVPEVVPATAGILVAPNSPEEFAAALRRLLDEPATRKAMAVGAARAGAALPSWRDTAAIIAQFLESRA
ncbi:MAG: glycosyltransferase family 4 protein [Pseudorhizobium pelagicum]|uniref:glycosyltransferase family 4 protein n=1 Tax=Pseudorhizobium pelagicum TaxID=1509405 RepID=UPI0034614830